MLSSSGFRGDDMAGGEEITGSCAEWASVTAAAGCEAQEGAAVRAGHVKREREESAAAWARHVLAGNADGGIVGGAEKAGGHADGGVKAGGRGGTRLRTKGEDKEAPTRSMELQGSGETAEREAGGVGVCR